MLLDRIVALLVVGESFEHFQHFQDFGFGEECGVLIATSTLQV